MLRGIRDMVFVWGGEQIIVFVSVCSLFHESLYLLFSFSMSLPKYKTSPLLHLSSIIQHRSQSNKVHTIAKDVSVTLL